jgi:hypothetical protein
MLVVCSDIRSAVAAAVITLISSTILKGSCRKLLRLKRKERFSKDNVFITGKPLSYFLHSLDYVVSSSCKLRSI